MSVKILITRRFREEHVKEITARLNKFRVMAMNQPGYIGGETLFGYSEPQTVLVISSWETVNNWLTWVEHPDRKAMDKELRDLLLAPPEYAIFLHGETPHTALRERRKSGAAPQQSAGFRERKSPLVGEP